MKRTNTSGFTLIELLVVVAIIGILATIVTVSFRGIQADARDANRQAEVKNIQLAMERYYANNAAYPAYAPGADGEVPAEVKSVLADSFPVFPTDPQDTGSCAGGYCWVDNAADGQKYCLYAILEKEGTVPDTETVYFVADEGFVREDQSATTPSCSL
ncbi:MAG: type II secretion system protein [bacterium]|nr:type II secretion system protein [bacterium]